MTDPARTAAALSRSLGDRETTALSEGEEAEFRKWVAKNKIRDLDHPDSHYDYRGYWKQYGSKPHQQGAHFTDEYKQHGHPTFSEESNYSRMPGDGGTWEGEKFTPSDFADPEGYDSRPKPAFLTQIQQPMAELDAAYADETRKKKR